MVADLPFCCAARTAHSPCSLVPLSEHKRSKIRILPRRCSCIPTRAAESARPLALSRLTALMEHALGTPAYQHDGAQSDAHHARLRPKKRPRPTDKDDLQATMAEQLFESGSLHISTREGDEEDLLVCMSPGTLSYTSSDCSFSTPPTRTPSCTDTTVTALSNVDDQQQASTKSGGKTPAKSTTSSRKCIICGTHTTPKWRGPRGNVCNACGLAERKKRSMGKTYAESTAPRPPVAKNSSSRRPGSRRKCKPSSPSLAETSPYPVLIARDSKESAEVPAHAYNSPERSSSSRMSALRDNKSTAIPPDAQLGSHPRAKVVRKQPCYAHLAQSAKLRSSFHATPRVSVSLSRASKTKNPPGRFHDRCCPMQRSLHADNLTSSNSWGTQSPTSGEEVDVDLDDLNSVCLADELADFDLGCDLLLGTEEIDSALQVKDDLSAAAMRDFPQYQLYPIPIFVRAPQAGSGIAGRPATPTFNIPATLVTSPLVSQYVHMSAEKAHCAKGPNQAAMSREPHRGKPPHFPSNSMPTHCFIQHQAMADPNAATGQNTTPANSWEYRSSWPPFENQPMPIAPLNASCPSFFGARMEDDGSRCCTTDEHLFADDVAACIQIPDVMTA